MKLFLPCSIDVVQLQRFGYNNHMMILLLVIACIIGMIFMFGIQEVGMIIPFVLFGA